VCKALNEEKAVLEENSNTLIAGLGGKALFLHKLVMVPPAIAPAQEKIFLAVAWFKLRRR
jgi:hypothetical protein